MSSSSMSESYQSSEMTCEPDVIALDDKISAVNDGTKGLELEIAKMKALQESIYKYKGKHMDGTEEVREKITEMSREIANSGKNLVNSCDEGLKNVAAVTEPYINGGVASVEPGGPSVLDRCILLLGTINGIDATIKKTEKLSSIVFEHHKMLNIIEAKQREAANRYEKVNNIRRLSREYPTGDPLHDLAAIPRLLLALNRSPDVSDYYKKVFNAMEERVSSFFKELSHNGPSKVVGNCSLLTTLSSLSNGEIDLQSIKDPSEAPIDSCKSAGSSQ